MKKKTFRPDAGLVVVRLTPAEADSLLDAIRSCDMMGEPDDYDPALIRAMSNARSKIIHAVRRSSGDSPNVQEERPAEGGRS